MKRIFNWITGSLLLVMLLSISPRNARAQAGVSVSFQTFYDDLAPYGQWIDDPEYGYVWAPDVSRDFRPYYSGGHWAMTDYGNTWVSDYDWGWAPFHYGRWAQSGSYGWIWVPGSEWGPAWVSWRSGGGNYGWAPMAPGISLGVSLGSYYAPDDWWTFIPQQYIYSNSYYNYWRGPRYNNIYIRNTIFINNTYVYNNHTYGCGPRRHDVERAIGRRVHVYNIRNENRPGRSTLRSNSINMFRPAVNRPAATNRREAPRNAVRAQQSVVKRTAVTPARNADRRNEGTQPRQANGRDRNAVNPANNRTPVQRDHRTNRVSEDRMREGRNPDRPLQNERSRQDLNRAPQERIQQQRQDRPVIDRQPVERPQREWRRPEPRQIQRNEQRIERPQQRMERPQPQQRMERPQGVERQAPAQRGGEHRGRGR